ncbi:hypothetical protein GGE65_000306 [Skermanella aerolata]
MHSVIDSGTFHSCLPAMIEDQRDDQRQAERLAGARSGVAPPDLAAVAQQLQDDERVRSALVLEQDVEKRPAAITERHAEQPVALTGFQRGIDEGAVQQDRRFVGQTA